MHSLTIENYVKSIYNICLHQPGKSASTGQVAEALGVAPGTVTSMLKTLNAAGLATYAPYEGVRLTESGETLALRILRRHRLIELFLTTTLKLSWDKVHDEAEHLEHAVSDLLVDRIDAFLGNPETDPHGDPIPRADGSVPRPDSLSLTQWTVGNPFRLVRVLDQTPSFLRYLSEAGLPLGAHGKVMEHRREAGTVIVRMGVTETTLGRDAAEKILVTEAGSGALERTPGPSLGNR